MIAFDADVLTDFFVGNTAVVMRSSQFSAKDLAIPIVVVEEVFRGRLLAIRRAEAAKSDAVIVRAYEMLQSSVQDFLSLTVLPYALSAEALFRDWRSQRIRIGTHDLRIAAICVAVSARIVTRNRRDFEKVPGLSFEIWT